MSFRDLKMIVLLMALAMTSLFATPSHAAGYDTATVAIPVAVSTPSIINDNVGGGSGNITDQTITGKMLILYAKHVHGVGCSHNLYRSPGYHSRSMLAVSSQYHNNLGGAPNQTVVSNDLKVPWHNF